MYKHINTTIVNFCKVAVTTSTVVPRAHEQDCGMYCVILTNMDNITSDVKQYVIEITNI